MVEFYIADTKIKISFLFVSLLSLLSLVDRSGSIFLSVVFSIFHEMGHVIAIRICNGRIDELSFHPYGIAIKLSETFTPLEELFVLASGCIVNLVFLFLSNGTIYYINMSIFLFNILPIANLDGGRIAKLLLANLFGEEKGERVALIVSFLTLLPLSVLGFYVAITAKQPSLLICSIYLATIILIKREKLF